MVTCIGYGIVKEVESRSCGGIRLELRGLYHYIWRLADEGMVEPADRHAVRGEGASLDGRAGQGGVSEGTTERRRYSSVTG